MKFCFGRWWRPFRNVTRSSSTLYVPVQNPPLITSNNVCQELAIRVPEATKHRSECFSSAEFHSANVEFNDRTLWWTLRFEPSFNCCNKRLMYTGFNYTTGKLEWMMVHKKWGALDPFYKKRGKRLIFIARKTRILTNPCF